MSNIQIFQESPVPAYTKHTELSAFAQALAGGSEVGKRISVKGGVFRLYDAGKEVIAIEDRHLDVVIVNASPKVSRVYYEGAYVEGANVAPTCWSPKGDVPDPSCKTPQGASCASCPKNVKGSGQGDTRACRYNQRLAVVLANDIEDGEVMQLTLAATSIFGDADGENMPLQAYVRGVLAAGGDPGKVVTRLKFDTKAPVPKLFFKPMRWLSDDELESCVMKGKSPEALRAITMTVSQQGAPSVAAAAPLSIAGTPPKASKPAVVVTPEDDEPPAPAPKARKAKAAEPVEDAEPTVRSVAPVQNAVPLNTKLASTLAEWDDE